MESAVPAMSGTKAEQSGQILACLRQLLDEHEENKLKRDVGASRSASPPPPALGSLEVGDVFPDLPSVKNAVISFKTRFNKQMLVAQCGVGNEYYK
jgi:hypothetical protein